jgi:tetratricopeptide (TPR) repeat protein
MKKLTLLLVFLISIIAKQSIAQTEEIDSLRTILIKIKEDTNKVNLYYEIAKLSFPIGEYDTCSIYSEKCLKLSKKLGFKRGISDGYYLKGLLLSKRSNYKESIDWFKKSALVKEEIKEYRGLGGAYNHIGLMYNKLGKYDQAVEYCYKSLQLREKIGDKKGMAASISNIGFIYYDQKKFDDALKYHTKALEIREEINDIQGIASCNQNIGLIFWQKNKYEEALRYHFKCLELSKQINEKNRIAEAYGNIGLVYDEMGDYEKALFYYNEILKMKTELNDLEGIEGSYINLGSLYMQMKEFDKAKKCLNKALDIAIEIDNKLDISEIYANLALLDTAKGDYKSGFKNYVKYISYKDSLLNEENSRKLMEQSISYEFEKQKAIDDAQHDKLIAIEREEKEKQKIILYASIIGGFMLIFFSIFIYNRLKITQKQKDIITVKEKETQKQKEELQEKNHEILQSITYAKRLQQSILPPPRLVKEYMKDSFVLYMPKDIVAGDFYWIESHNNKIYFAAADCTGHGVPGAMVSMVCHNALNRALLEFGLHKPSLILDKASEIVEETFSKSEDNVQDGMDISLFCLDTQTRELEWAGANNPLWMIKPLPNPSPKERDNSSPLERLGEVIEIKPDKQPVGRYENRKPFTNHTIQLNEGDSLFSITDGYADQFGGEKGKKYTYKKLREFLVSINNKPMSIQKDELIAEFEKWRGNNEQVDDICIIGVKI